MGRTQSIGGGRIKEMGKSLEHHHPSRKPSGGDIGGRHYRLSLAQLSSFLGLTLAESASPSSRFSNACSARQAQPSSGYSP
ncbi:hypothetical protein PGT21_033081 [Puccinia graminis f. sp. tritici]|uniref:Uncharacterized protein n=1 Tax=Puccinia graminis f. sp. tritici TaxID=56615 RepID=A0A5B0Q7Q2_PUCGR|nr:hypothetical protein PGT21_033081 [Puccinia graminis f. sp. tritici]KAA1133187.1 hypothetical protein PGTUg99_024932 [Puccinia graminis f. sp. tritici]